MEVTWKGQFQRVFETEKNRKNWKILKFGAFVIDICQHKTRNFHVFRSRSERKSMGGKTNNGYTGHTGFVAGFHLKRRVSVCKETMFEHREREGRNQRITKKNTECGERVERWTCRFQKFLESENHKEKLVRVSEKHVFLRVARRSWKHNMTSQFQEIKQIVEFGFLVWKFLCSTNIWFLKTKASVITKWLWLSNLKKQGSGFYFEQAIFEIEWVACLKLFSDCLRH